MNNIATMGHNNPPTEIEILKQRLDGYKEEKALFDKLSKKEVPAVIEEDSTASELTDYIKSLKALRGSVEKIFKKEKEPFFQAGKAADEWKNKYWKDIDALIDTASIPVIKWNKQKEEAERKRQFDIAEKARQEAEALAKEAEAHADAGINDTAEELMDMAIQSEHKADMISNNAVHGVVGRSRGDYSVSSVRKPWTGKLESRAALDLNALRNYFTEAELEKAIKAAVRDGVREIQGAVIYQEDKLSVR